MQRVERPEVAMEDRKPLVVIGDTLLDQDVDGEVSRLAPDAPVPVLDVLRDHSRPGGAGLAAALAARSGRPTVLVTALGDEDAADAVRHALAERVRLLELPLRGDLPVKSRVRTGGRPLLRIDRGSGVPGAPRAAVRAALDDVLNDAAAVLVADYGRGVVERVRDRLAAVVHRMPVVWDPHPRGGCPVPGVRLATPNASEARTFTDEEGRQEADREGLRAHGARGALLAGRWQAASVSVTLGDRGALLARPGGENPMYVPTARPVSGDPCGAGDCFAATAAAALGAGALPEEAVQAAVAEAAAFVANGGAGNPALWEPAGRRRDRPREPADPFELAAAVRSRGGTVVATGGCFDLLHAGHVGLLENARRTGDCLVVCVNSDASVRRLKGPGRPLNPCGDRVRVLSGLGCVDAVAVFDEDTPEALLRRLRPDIWVKGGDYRADSLPEAPALREWGGQALVLPYLDGRSTTEIARRAALSDGAPPLTADRSADGRGR